MDFLKKHGEKILFLVLVAGLALSLFFLLTADHQAEQATGPGRRSQLSAIDTEALDVVLSRISGKPFQLAPATNSFTAEARVICINPDCRSLIPRGATTCPYCEVAQTIPDRDSDGDGILDKVESQYGMDPNDPNDAHQDKDGDGFSNLEEIQAGFDPVDPAVHPSLIARLRLGEMAHLETFVRVKGWAKGIKAGSYTIQLEWKYPDANRWENGLVATGARFGRENEFLVEKFEEKRVEYEPGRWRDESVVVFKSGRHTLRIGQNQEDAIRESTATLILPNRPAWKQVVKIGQRFELDKIEYMVVDMDKSSVVLRGASGGEPITVRAPTPEELKPKVPVIVPAAKGRTPSPALLEPEALGGDAPPPDEEIF
jgi:hypothetical protein